MKRKIAAVLTALLVAMTLMSVAPTSAHADTPGIDGQQRRDTATYGNPVYFNQGDPVFGAHIYIGGNTYEMCYFRNAPGNGSVVDGTAHYWTNEPQGQPRYIGPCQNPVQQTSPPAAQTTMYFSPGATVTTFSGGTVYYSNGAVYCYYPCTLSNAQFSGYVVNGNVTTSTQRNFNPGDTVTGEIHYGNGTLYCQYCGPYVMSFYGYVINGSVIPSNQPASGPPFFGSNGQAGWNGNTTVAVSGTGSYLWENNWPNHTQGECWFPSTPGGGGAVNPVSNIATVTFSVNSQPNLKFCDPGNGMEIRSSRWSAGSVTGVQGIAFATSGTSTFCGYQGCVVTTAKTCNGGNCIVSTQTAATEDGIVWFLAPVGSPAGSVSPFTPGPAPVQPTTTYGGPPTTM